MDKFIALIKNYINSFYIYIDFKIKVIIQMLRNFLFQLHNMLTKYPIQLHSGLMVHFILYFILLFSFCSIDAQTSVIISYTTKFPSSTYICWFLAIALKKRNLLIMKTKVLKYFLLCHQIYYYVIKNKIKIEKLQFMFS